VLSSGLKSGFSSRSSFGAVNWVMSPGIVCCHRTFSSGAVIWCGHLILSSVLSSDLSSEVVICCCHLVLLSVVVIWCYHLVLSSGVVLWCCHLVWPYSIVICGCHLVLSSDLSSGDFCPLGLSSGLSFGLLTGIVILDDTLLIII
jgi:hypothetical protein